MPHEHPPQIQLATINSATIALAKAIYIELGLAPIPLWGWSQTPDGPLCECPRGRDCQSPGKHPRIKGWQSRSVEDLAADESWQREGVGIGLRMGLQPNGSFLVAVDDDGDLTALESELGALSPTLLQKTGQGSHVIVSVDPALGLANTARRKGHRVDSRGQGGFIVVAPTVHPSGAQYRWLSAYWTPSPLPETWVQYLGRRLAETNGYEERMDAAWLIKRPGEQAEDDSRVKRARACLGGWRAKNGYPHDGSRGAFTAAMILTRGFELADHEALPILQDDLAHCDGPAWQRDEVKRKLAESRERGRMRLGELFAQDDREADRVLAMYRDKPRASKDEPAPDEHPQPVDPAIIEESLQTEQEPDLPLDALPGIIREMAAAFADAMGSPHMLTAMACYCTLAAACQGKARVRVVAESVTGNRESWTDPLTLWWIVTMPAGEGKSRAVNPILKPLLDWQREKLRYVQEHAPGIKRTRAALERRYAKLAEEGASISGADQWQWADEAGEKASELKGIERQLSKLKAPLAPQLLLSDCTPATIAKVLAHNREAAGYESAALIDVESTPLETILGRHSHGKPQLDLILRGYEAEPYSVARASQASDGLVQTILDAAHITIGCTMQPDVWHELATSTERLHSQGFIGRCILSAAGPLVPGTSNPVPPELMARWTSLVTALLDWRPSQPLTIEFPEFEPSARRCARAIHAIPSDQLGSSTRARFIGKVHRLMALGWLAEHGHSIAAEEWGEDEGTVPTVSRLGEPLSRENIGKNELSQLTQLSHRYRGGETLASGVAIIDHFFTVLTKPCARADLRERPAIQSETIASRLYTALRTASLPYPSPLPPPPPGLDSRDSGDSSFSQGFLPRQFGDGSGQLHRLMVDRAPSLRRKKITTWAVAMRDVCKALHVTSQQAYAAGEALVERGALGEHIVVKQHNGTEAVVWPIDGLPRPAGWPADGK